MVRVNGAPEQITFDKGARTAREVAAQWQRDHSANPAPQLEGQPLTRTERVVADEKDFEVKEYSDGTIRADSRIEAAPKPAPITAATEFKYTKADLDRLHDRGKNFMRLQVGSGLGVETQAVEERNPNVSWFNKSTPR